MSEQWLMGTAQNYKDSRYISAPVIWWPRTFFSTPPCSTMPWHFLWVLLLTVLRLLNCYFSASFPLRPLKKFFPLCLKGDGFSRSDSRLKTTRKRKPEGLMEISNRFHYLKVRTPLLSLPVSSIKNCSKWNHFICTAVGAACSFMASVSSCTEGAELPMCLGFSLSTFSLSLSVVLLTFTFA